MNTPSIEKVASQIVAFLPMRGAYAQVPQGMGRLYEWIGHNGLQPTGMPGAVYLTDPATVPESEAEWELWAPVTSASPREADNGEPGVKQLPARTVARILYQGPYEQVHEGYSALTGWIEEQGLVVVGPPEEYYLNDPGEASPAEYLTEIHFPIMEP